MILSIIIPVYNEKDTLLELFGRVLACNLPMGWEKEVIIIDDGSDQETKEIIKKLVFENLRIFINETNQGKGAALKKGFLAASGEALIIQDADLEYNPQDYINLLQPLINNEADVVFGSRYLTPGSRRFFFDYANWAITTIFNIFNRCHLSDVETCYKLINRKSLLKIKDKLRANDFSIEIEISSLLKEEKIVERQISYQRRSYLEGKKIKWLDGFKALKAIIKYS